MCGILAGFGETNLPIENSIKSLLHRGPDGCGHIKNKNWFLSHTRLSIVDVNGGQQPISSEDHKIHAVVNGEFYNSESIRHQLKSKGHTFKTKSDSEILIHLFEEHRTKCLDFLEGEFAFVLTDGNFVFAARDRFGVRPLFYVENELGIYFASEERALGILLNIPCKLDHITLGFASCFQYTPPERTWYQGINSIPAGCYIWKDSKTQTERYWEIPKESADADGQCNLREILEDSILKRIPTEVSSCSHLSGGLDSSIISITAKLPSYTVAFIDNQEYDESFLAQETATKAGISSTLVAVSNSDITNSFGEISRFNSAPFINGHAIAKYFLSKKINSDGIKVALTGEGADELFYGYSHLHSDYGRNQTEFSVEGVHTPLSANYTLHGYSGFIPNWIKAKHEMLSPLRRILNIPLETSQTSESYMFSFLEKIKNCQPAEIGSLSWTNFALQSYILRSLDDRLGMAHAVESRIPFLDSKLWELVRSKIRHEKHFQFREKDILRKIFAIDLPKSVINQKKHPFMAPPLLEISTEFTDRIYSVIPQKNQNVLREFLSQPDAPSKDAVSNFILSLSYMNEAW